MIETEIEYIIENRTIDECYMCDAGSKFTDCIHWDECRSIVEHLVTN